MAKIIEEMAVITVSRLVKENNKNDVILTKEEVENIENILTEFFDGRAIVEVTISE